MTRAPECSFESHSGSKTPFGTEGTCCLHTPFASVNFASACVSMWCRLAFTRNEKNMYISMHMITKPFLNLVLC